MKDFANELARSGWVSPIALGLVAYVALGYVLFHVARATRNLTSRLWAWYKLRRT